MPRAVRTVVNGLASRCFSSAKRTGKARGSTTSSSRKRSEEASVRQPASRYLLPMYVPWAICTCSERRRHGALLCFAVAATAWSTVLLADPSPPLQAIGVSLRGPRAAHHRWPPDTPA